VKRGSSISIRAPPSGGDRAAVGLESTAHEVNDSRLVLHQQDPRIGHDFRIRAAARTISHVTDSMSFLINRLSAP
jgi:hypothetical protein